MVRFNGNNGKRFTLYIMLPSKEKLYCVPKKLEITHLVKDTQLTKRICVVAESQGKSYFRVKKNRKSFLGPKKGRYPTIDAVVLSCTKELRGKGLPVTRGTVMLVPI